MTWLFWTFIALIVFFVIGSLGAKHTKKKKSIPSTVEKEAAELAATITTVEEYHALRQKLDRSYKGPEPTTDRGLQRLWRRQSVLKTAISIAKDKLGRWQYVPQLTLETPSHILNYAYKIYTDEEAKPLKETLPPAWHGNLAFGGGGLHKPPALLDSLKKFRAIIESDLPVEEAAKRINELVAGNPADFKPFLKNMDSDLELGDAWFVNKLVAQGLPLARELYRDGYTTPERCLAIDPEDFLKRKGVGPKTVEKLIQFQEKVRGTTK